MITAPLGISKPATNLWFANIVPGRVLARVVVMNSCWMWWWHMVRAPKRAGSVLPSSHRLAQEMARGVASFAAPGEHIRLLEVGAGTGAITRELIRRLPHTEPTLVEADATCCRYLRRRFPRAEVVEGLIEERLADVVRPCSALILVSSVPILNLNQVERTRLFHAYEIIIAAAERSQVVQYTYAPWLPGERARRLYGNRSLTVWKNIPPAWIWSRTHQGHTSLQLTCAAAT